MNKQLKVSVYTENGLIPCSIPIDDEKTTIKEIREQIEVIFLQQHNEQNQIEIQQGSIQLYSHPFYLHDDLLYKDILLCKDGCDDLKVISDYSWDISIFIGDLHYLSFPLTQITCKTNIDNIITVFFG